VELLYGVITNDVSDYINLLARIAHIICNHPMFVSNVTYLTCRRVFYYSLIMWYLARARGPQDAHAGCSVIEDLAFRRTVYQSAVSWTKYKVGLPFLLSTAENPVSHKYVATKGSKTFV
jgi:hypothetical protein